MGKGARIYTRVYPARVHVHTHTHNLRTWPEVIQSGFGKHGGTDLVASQGIHFLPSHHSSRLAGGDGSSPGKVKDEKEACVLGEAELGSRFRGGLSCPWRAPG